MAGLPFHPEDPAFNRANALYLAHASDVAYHRAPAAAAVERLGVEAVGFRHKVTRTRGYLGVCDTHAVLAFRGSDPVTLQTWVTDAFVRLVAREHYAGRVHQGFSSVLRRSWTRVEAILAAAEGKPLFVTGHSMGGALAVLTACRLAAAGRPPVAVYTFGAPRVGDAAFCAGYAVPTYRVVNRLDLVPELPLASVKRILPGLPRVEGGRRVGGLKRVGRRVPAYDHVNTLVYIDHDGAIAEGAAVKPWRSHAVARAVATRGKSFHEGITDHLITSYIKGLEGRTGDATARVRRRVAWD
ncbi:MAG TPA: lipase family protein [Humisphaera sp.]